MGFECKRCGKCCMGFRNPRIWRHGHESYEDRQLLLAEKKKHKGNARKIYPLTHCQELKDLQIFLCELCVCSVARAEEIASIVTTGEHQKNWLK